MTEIQLYEALSPKLGKDETQVLVNYIHDKYDNKFEQSKDVLATKEDILNLRNELQENINNLHVTFEKENSKLRNEFKEENSKLRNEFKEENSKLRNEFKEDNHKLRLEMKESEKKLSKEIQKSRADMIKWMFIFIIGQLAAIIGILKFLVIK
jgi:hypothetical protein